MKRALSVVLGHVALDEACRDPSAPHAVFRWNPADDGIALDPRTAAVLALGELALAQRATNQGNFLDVEKRHLAGAGLTVIYDDDPVMLAARAADAAAP